MSTKELTRKQLYNLVWKKPITHLAKELELSDVGLAKTCKRYNIPRPPRGYWNKKAAGHKLKKEPLPRGEDATIEFDLIENKARRSAFSRDTEKSKTAKDEIQEAREKATHAIALKVEEFFQTATADSYDRRKISRVTVPRILATSANTARVVEFISALAHSLERKGIQFENGNKENGLFFTFRQDKLQLQLEEELEDYEIEPTEEQKRKPAWTWDNKRTRASGRIRIQITSPGGTRGRCRWVESGKLDLMHYLPMVQGRMESLFDYYEECRVEAKRERIKREEENKRWEERQRRNEHVRELNKHILKRCRNLILASMQYRLVDDILLFRNACLEHWGGEEDKLTKEQKAWLDYAGRIANYVNPITDGYPNLEKDGPKDWDSIPMGGPYPETRKIKPPFLLEEIERIVKRESPSYVYRTW